MGNTYEIPRSIRCNNREKLYAKEKIITHKIVFTWFGNLSTFTELQGFHCSQGKIQCNSTVFLSKKWHENPNLQNNNFYILHTGFTMVYKNGLKFFSLKPPLYVLSLRKSLIKNYINISHGLWQLVLLAVAVGVWLLFLLIYQFASKKRETETKRERIRDEE